MSVTSRLRERCYSCFESRKDVFQFKTLDLLQLGPLVAYHQIVVKYLCRLLREPSVGSCGDLTS